VPSLSLLSINFSMTIPNCREYRDRNNRRPNVGRTLPSEYAQSLLVFDTKEDESLRPRLVPAAAASPNSTSRHEPEDRRYPSPGSGR